MRQLLTRREGRTFALGRRAAFASVRDGLPSRLPRLTDMQPIYEVTLSRPWHWGIAIVSAPGAAVPETLADSLVTATAEALVIKVRHAQDIEAEVFEDDWQWSTSTIRVRYVADLEVTTDEVIFDGILRLPDGRLAIGDADSEVILNDLDVATQVRVVALDRSDFGANDIRLDVAPQG